MPQLQQSGWGINRTIIELKSAISMYSSSCSIRINRTIIELKYMLVLLTEKLWIGINRTIIELKSVQLHHTD